MTPSIPRPQDQESSRKAGGQDRGRISADCFAGMWIAEVPKIVALHEAERRQVREALGLA
ncbi:MAG: hypothetical protein HY823_06635 [Acidobacteria bacterium]|nr:hypothetical protein [Acidobacteriota bacterium]